MANELLHILVKLGGLAKDDIVELLSIWNGTLGSKLIGSLISSLSTSSTNNSDIFEKATSGYDEEADRLGRFVADSIKRGVAIPTVSSSLATMQLTRTLGRCVVSKLGCPSENPMVESWQVAEDAYHALYGSMLVSLVQALLAIKAANDEHGWNVRLEDCLNAWRYGSLISSNLLDQLVAAIGRSNHGGSAVSIMEDPSVASTLTRSQNGWRRIVVLGIASGVSTATLSSSLMYYDSNHTIPAYQSGQQFQFMC